MFLPPANFEKCNLQYVIFTVSNRYFDSSRNIHNHNQRSSFRSTHNGVSIITCVRYVFIVQRSSFHQYMMEFPSLHVCVMCLLCKGQVSDQHMMLRTLSIYLDHWSSFGECRSHRTSRNFATAPRIVYTVKRVVCYPTKHLAAPASTVRQFVSFC